MIMCEYGVFLNQGLDFSDFQLLKWHFTKLKDTKNTGGKDTKNSAQEWGVWSKGHPRSDTRNRLEYPGLRNTRKTPKSGRKSPNSKMLTTATYARQFERPNQADLKRQELNRLVDTSNSREFPGLPQNSSKKRNRNKKKKPRALPLSDFINNNNRKPNITYNKPSNETNSQSYYTRMAMAGRNNPPPRWPNKTNNSNNTNLNVVKNQTNKNNSNQNNNRRKNNHSNKTSNNDTNDSSPVRAVFSS
eukprot:UN24160